MIRTTAKDFFSFSAALLLATIFTLVFNLPMHAQNVADIKVHFSSEVAIPNQLLPPGDYVFHRVDANDPSTYEIEAGDGLKSYGFVHVEPTVREDKGEAAVELSAPDATGVRMVQAWYGPGENDGYELTYSGKDLRKLDELARQQVQSSGSLPGQP